MRCPRWAYGEGRGLRIEKKTTKVIEKLRPQRLERRVRESARKEWWEHKCSRTFKRTGLKNALRSRVKKIIVKPVSNGLRSKRDT